MCTLFFRGRQHWTNRIFEYRVVKNKNFKNFEIDIVDITDIRDIYFRLNRAIDRAIDRAIE